MTNIVKGIIVICRVVNLKYLLKLKFLLKLKYTILAILAISSVMGVTATFAQETTNNNDLIPSWVKGVFSYWIDDKINDAEVIDAIQFLIDSDIIKIGTNNQIINSLTFDCAKQWDKFQENWKRIQEVTLVNTEQVQRLTENLEGSMLDLFENECASTVNDWAYRTYDEGSVWMMGEQWKVWAYLEQKMIEENLTFKEAGEKYLYNTSTSPTKVISSIESYSKCGAGTVFDDASNSCILDLEEPSKETPKKEESDPEKSSTSWDTDSKCGAGTIFDEVSNSCVLEGSKISSESNSKCGADTVFNDASNSCILENVQKELEQ